MGRKLKLKQTIRNGGKQYRPPTVIDCDALNISNGEADVLVRREVAVNYIEPVPALEPEQAPAPASTGPEIVPAGEQVVITDDAEAVVVVAVDVLADGEHVGDPVVVVPGQVTEEPVLEQAQDEQAATSDDQNAGEQAERARHEDGTFKADDPATPDVNEAYVQTEQAPALAGKSNKRKR